MELLVEGDEALRVFLYAMQFVRFLRLKALDEHKPIGVIGAGEEVVGNATRLGARLFLDGRRRLENPVARTDTCRNEFDGCGGI